MSDRRSGADALVEVLVAHEVPVVWGLCGHTVVAVLDALGRSEIRFIPVHHEQMAAHAADAQARVSGRAGVVLVHLGPGLTNALTGIANASLDSVPMVVISGNIQSYFFGHHAHMETLLHADADQARAAAPFCKRVWRVERAEALTDVLRAAFREAEGGRPGPVLVDVAMDVFSRSVEVDASVTPIARAARPGLSDDLARAIVERLGAAEHPVLYVGEGVIRSDAGDVARQVAERFNLPIAYELMGKGAVSDEHPLIVGMTGFWGHPAANAATRDADLLLAVGARFGELDASSWRPGVTFTVPPTELVHIDVDERELGRTLPPTLAAVADPREALEAILLHSPSTASSVGLPTTLQGLKDAFAAEHRCARRSEAFPLRPQRLLADLRVALPEEAVIVADTGWNKNGVGQQFPMYRGRTLLAPGGYATMGFGPAAVLGATVAAGGAPVVALVGDGAFLSNLSVVVTAVEQRIPAIWIVMNNGTYGTIEGLQRRHFGNAYGSTFDAYEFDYVAFASSAGATGVRIERPDDLRQVIDKAVGSGQPWVIDVPVTTDPVPTDGIWDINDLFAR